MNNRPRKKLHELIDKYGSSIIDDLQRCEGLIRDYCSEHELETNVLVFALKAHVPHELLKSQEGLPLPVLITRLQIRLQDKYGLSEEAAKWSVEAWVEGLGISKSDHRSVNQELIISLQSEENRSPKNLPKQERSEPYLPPQDEIRKEVITSMESLLEEEGLGLEYPKQGEIRQGVIASIGENEILVSIGTSNEGVIPTRELDQVDRETRESFTVGQEIPVYVVNPLDPNGNVQLSFIRALEELDWKLAEQLLVDGEPFLSKVIGFNKGGLIVPLGQIRGFIPASQVSILRRMDASGGTPEKRWGTMVGEDISCTVIEINRERRRLILSERAALKETPETLKERLLDELKEGEIRTGRVTSLADFGAFINMEGADGLVHLSEISWDHIDHPREILKIGQEVKVKVIGIDWKRKRISLSIRQLQEDPWLKKLAGIKEGQLIEGMISHLTEFGAFARLDKDLEGLIHISELSEQRIIHPKEVVHEGDVLTLRVIKIEPEKRRIGLSLTKVDSPAYADLDWKMILAEVMEDDVKKASKSSSKGISDTYNELKSIIVDLLNVDESKVSPEARFREDLEADSLDLVELIMAVEDHYGGEISDEDAQSITTVGEAVKYIDDHIVS